METIVKNRRQKNSQKGDAEMKTLVEEKQTNRNATETVAGQQIQEVIAPKPEVAESLPGKQKKETASAEATPNMGLCATCTEAPHCAYVKNASRPILFCEMFNEGEPKEQIETEQPLSSPRSPEEGRPVSQLKGLCANCDHRDTCTYPKPEGGVWHCEEYR
jgi:hypothetical protein